jgi:hypothetical protein
MAGSGSSMYRSESTTPRALRPIEDIHGARKQERELHMTKFLFIYRSHKDTFDTMAPEEIQRFNQKWQTWRVEGSEQGWMLDASKALRTEGRVVSHVNTVTEGPLVEGNDVVRGYVTVEADTLDTATELAKGCPVLQHGGRVEVRPFFRTHPGE